MQSVFLQSLGHSIANSIWQMAILWILYNGLALLLRLNSAAKYRLAVASQFTGLILFAFNFMFYFTAGTGSSVSTDIISTKISINAFLPWISIAYLSGVVFMLVKWARGFRHTQLIRRDGIHKIPVEWRLFAKRIASQMGVRKEVKIFLSEKILSPLTIGFIKPVILVPLASINHLSPAQLEAVLVHEMAHIRRHDYLLNILLSFIELVLFFNPFIRLINKSLAKERENSCDDYVLQFQYDGADYAAGLLQIAYLQFPQPAFAMNASGNKKELLNRVRRIAGYQEKRSVEGRKIWIALLTGAIIGIFMFVSLSNTTIVASKNDKRPDFQTAIRQVHSTPKINVTSLAIKVELKTKLLAKQVAKAKTKPQKDLPHEIAAAIVSDPTNNEIAIVTPVEEEQARNAQALHAIRQLDLEQLLTTVFASTQFSEEDKKELKRISNTLLSDKDRELLRREFKDKHTLRTLTSTVSLPDDNADPATNQPILINIALKDPNPEDEQQIAKIKLAILQQINLIISSKSPLKRCRL